MRIFREKLAKQTLEFEREKEARQWAVHAAREAAEALREMRLERASFRDAMEAFEARSIAREAERAERATDEIKRRLLSWVGAEQLREAPAPHDLDEAPEQGLRRFVGRFGPEALRDLAAPRRAGRLRELACRIARSVWVEGDDSIHFEPALLLLSASGHRLAPRHGATLRFDVHRDGLSVEWLDEAQPIEVRLSASDGFALRGVREWARTPIH